METFISFIKYILNSNIINFLLMVWLLAWVLKKIAIKDSFENSITKVENTIQESENQKKDSQKLVNNARSSLDKLPEELKNIKQFSQQKAEIFKQQLEETSKKSIQKINDNIEKVIQIEEKKASSNLTTQTITNSIEHSKNNILKMLSENPELHNKFIEESLWELDKTEI